MVKCEIITTETVVEGETYTVYGLAFNKNNSKEPFKKIFDIYSELSLIENLRDKINNNDVDEIHIDDIIEDLVS